MSTAPANTLRDRERKFVLGLKYRAKAVCADATASDLAQTDADELTLITGVSNVLADQYDRL